MPRMLKQDLTVDGILEELVYTDARLSSDPNARDLAAPYAILIGEAEGAAKAQRAVWREETRAQAEVDAIDYRLDQRTKKFDLVFKLSNHEHPQAEQRRRRYYGELTTSDIIDLALASQLKVSQTWPASLAGEPEEALRAFAPGFAQDIADGGAALAERDRAAAVRKDHRVRELGALIDRVNKLRRETHGELSRRAPGLDLAADWADGFFRREQRHTPAKRRLEKKRRAILASFEAREIAISEELKKRLRREGDPAVLDRWLAGAATAASAEAALAPAGEASETAAR
jgi:hypothetical protein